ncbi:MAG: GLPGLI family protein [Flavobacterium sp.]|uniref:GLPGLI family protein n=1 Tax=Flavobacterium sp. TaxID=239 RepID=UPI002FC8B5CF
MKKLLLIFLLSLVCNATYSQKQFNYLCYVDDTVRTGVLLFHEKENKAIYIDQMNNFRNSKTDEKPIFTVNVSGDKDFVYYKQNLNELNYTYELLKIPYLINDNTLTIDWKLTTDKKEIQGLICSKATTTFRGRNWTVWYYPGIPVVYGPWKFYGLPGLMVELTEDTNRFAFVLTEIIEEPVTSMENLNLKKFKQVDIKMFDELFNDAMNFRSLSGSRDYVMEGEAFKRNVIELMFEWEKQVIK